MQKKVKLCPFTWTNVEEEGEGKKYWNWNYKLWFQHLNKKWIFNKKIHQSHKFSKIYYQSRKIQFQFFIVFQTSSSIKFWMFFAKTNLFCYLFFFRLDPKNNKMWKLLYNHTHRLYNSTIQGNLKKKTFCFLFIHSQFEIN